MQDGDIILLRVKKFSKWYRWLLAKLIQLIDRTYYHHCVVYIDGKIHDADAKGIVLHSLDKYKGSNYVVLRPLEPLTEVERSFLLLLFNNQVGKKYDYYSTLLFQLIYRFTFIWLGRTHSKAEDKLTCSEHCILPYHHVRGYFRKPWLVSPGDIMRSQGYFKIVKESVL